MDLPTHLLANLPPEAMDRLASSDGNLCLSGAAAGADAYWSELAWQRGDGVVHWSFAGHRSAARAGAIVALDPASLAAADPALARAAKALRRPWPPRAGYSASLLRRNYFQVAWADAVYAIATFDADGRIGGGTAWTVQMFLDRFDGEDCAAYLFDQGRGRWRTWCQHRWASVQRPPAPAGIWAGVGTRGLQAVGMAAMDQLMGEQAD